MEFICPACGKFTEVQEQKVFRGNHFKCNTCWSELVFESTQPLRVRFVSEVAETPVASGGRAVRRGGKNG